MISINLLTAANGSVNSFAWLGGSRPFSRQNHSSANLIYKVTLFHYGSGIVTWNQISLSSKRGHLGNLAFSLCVCLEYRKQGSWIINFPFSIVSIDNEFYFHACVHNQVSIVDLVKHYSLPKASWGNILKIKTIFCN